MNKKILFLILLGTILLPNIGFAQPTIPGMIQGAENTAVMIASAVVIILWLVAGILFLLASGSPEKLKSARTAIITAVAGTVIVIIAWYAMDLVGKAFNI